MKIAKTFTDSEWGWLSSQQEFLDAVESGNEEIALHVGLNLIINRPVEGDNEDVIRALTVRAEVIERKLAYLREKQPNARHAIAKAEAELAEVKAEIKRQSAKGISFTT